MTNKPNICVIGSINMDLTIMTEKVPKKGETVLGKNFATYPGGKGANQAVAAARLGANVAMIGAVGDDIFGKTLLSHLETEGIHSKGIKVVPSVETGIANIILSKNDNRIIVAAGANQWVTPALVEKHRDLIQKSDVIVLQFEIPMETILYTIRIAKEYGVKTIVNPAPYQQLPKEVLIGATYLTPNEIEVASMKKDPLFESVQDKMIITVGDKGVQIMDKDGQVETIPAYQVEVKDTTGAGDTFNGAFATQLGKGKNIRDSVSFANAAAALSVTKTGAQNGIPFVDEVEQFLLERKTQQ